MSDPRDNEEQPITVIVPASRPPSGARDARGRSAALRWLAIGVLSVMLMVLAGVVFLLPDLVAEREARTPPPPPPAEHKTRTAPSENDRLKAREKREADRRLGLVLRAKTELEAEGVSIWGGEEYDAAMDRLASGDAEREAGRYPQAGQAYAQTLRLLETLAAAKGERGEAAVAAGETALAAGDGPGSRAAFEVALAVDSQNARAQQGMQRARVLETVTALLDAGAGEEARDALDAARDKYAQALALDSRSPRAHAALERVSARIRERDFRAAMSAALAALEDGDFDASRTALDRAGALEPAAAELADARVRLERARERALIAEHRRRAERLEREERWREAGEHYAAALDIDPNAAFARSGETRSTSRARIHAELDGFLAEPGRLNDAEPRDNARRLIAAAGSVDAAAEPMLAEKLERLAEAIKMAETPMKVRLESDNLTDVTVYKVGRFGRFARRELMLTPGTYVAVGTRTGYRDVRVEFTLTAGREPDRISVRCREKI